MHFNFDCEWHYSGSYHACDACIGGTVKRTFLEESLIYKPIGARMILF